MPDVGDVQGVAAAIEPDVFDGAGVGVVELNAMRRRIGFAPAVDQQVADRDGLEIGGGVAHGPKPKDWSTSLPKKVRRMGIRCVLSGKLLEGRLWVFEDFSIEEAKTKSLAAKLERVCPLLQIIVSYTSDDLCCYKLPSMVIT